MKGKPTWKPIGLRAKRWRHAAHSRLPVVLPPTKQEKLAQGGSVNVDAKDLDRYRQSLLAKRREIEGGAIGTVVAAGGERQADVIDQATDAAQADLQAHLHQTDSHLLRAIEEALTRIDRQAFGVCETCKRPISEARLEAVPWTRLCRDCKEQQQG